jgi:hypothetical protein
MKNNEMTVKCIFENTSLEHIFNCVHTNTLGLLEENGELIENIEITSPNYPDIYILYKQLYVGNFIAQIMTEMLFFEKIDIYKQPEDESVEHIDESIKEDIVERELINELFSATVYNRQPNFLSLEKFASRPINITDVETEIYDFFVIKKVENILMSMSLFELMNAGGGSYTDFIKEESWNLYLKVYKKKE